MIYLRVVYCLLVIFGCPFLLVKIFRKAREKHPLYMILTALFGTLLMISAIMAVSVR